MYLVSTLFEGGGETLNAPMAIIFARHKANVQTRRFLHALMKVPQDLLTRIVAMVPSTRSVTTVGASLTRCPITGEICSKVLLYPEKRLSNRSKGFTRGQHVFKHCHGRLTYRESF